jgi:Na+/melibiose symporter-like transporter
VTTTIQDHLQQEAKRAFLSVATGAIVVGLALAFFRPVGPSDRAFFYWLLVLIVVVDVLMAAVLIATKLRCPRCRRSLAECWWAIRSGSGPTSCPHCHASFQEPCQSTKA